MRLRLLLIAALAPLAAATVHANCAAIVGFDQYVAHARGVIVGDMHGTEEAPAFLSDLICNYTKSGRPVVVAVEYTTLEQDLIDALLNGPSSDRSPRLFAGQFWNRPSQDGRTSQAMMKFYLGLREQIRSGAHIRVIAFDPPQTGPAAASAGAAFDGRDASMAEFLRSSLSSLKDNEVPIIFTGNVHARKAKGIEMKSAPPGMENVEPLAYRLRDLGYLTMNINYDGGSLWACFTPSDCAVREIGEEGKAVEAYSIGPSKDPAYDLVYFVGRLTASLPASATK